MNTDYPENLRTGDILISDSGRCYTVIDHDTETGDVTYASAPIDDEDGVVTFIPDEVEDGPFRIKTEHERQLNWVKRVEGPRGGLIWPEPLEPLPDIVKKGPRLVLPPEPVTNRTILNELADDIQRISVAASIMVANTDGEESPKILGFAESLVARTEIMASRLALIDLDPADD